MHINITTPDINSDYLLEVVKTMLGLWDIKAEVKTKTRNLTLDTEVCIITKSDIQECKDCDICLTAYNLANYRWDHECFSPLSDDEIVKNWESNTEKAIPDYQLLCLTARYNHIKDLDKYISGITFDFTVNDSVSVYVAAGYLALHIIKLYAPERTITDNAMFSRYCNRIVKPHMQAQSKQGLHAIDGLEFLCEERE